MNITEDDLRSYLEVFLSTLQGTAAEFLPEDLQKRLLHLSLLPARVIGYVSTQFGVAIEYQPAEATVIDVRRGSARVEDLVAQAPTALRDIGPAYRTGGRRSRISDATLLDAFPFRLTRREADLTIADVTFRAGEWTREIHYAEVFGDRSRDRWTKDKAVGSAKDEVLAALVEARRAEERQVSLSEYIARFKAKTVLVLGSYDADGIARLRAIAEALTRLGYDPLMIKDVPDVLHQALFQRVVAVGAVSRFIVIDDSSKSGHLLEVQQCMANFWVTVLLRAGGRGSSFMTAGLSNLSSVILEQPYDPASPEPALAEAAQWAEGKLTELQRAFDKKTYPWRGVGG